MAITDKVIVSSATDGDFDYSGRKGKEITCNQEKSMQPN